MYAYRHLSGLLQQTFTASNMSITNKKLKDAVAFLDSLSQEVNKEDDPKSVVNLLTGRMQGNEASKLSLFVNKLTKK